MQQPFLYTSTQYPVGVVQVRSLAQRPAIERDDRVSSLVFWRAVASQSFDGRFIYVLDPRTATAAVLYVFEVAVEAGAGGTTRGTVNLDITPSLKARGSLGSDGEQSLGLFFEKDY